MSEETKPIKMTKKGLPDKRSITSKLNINKAQNKVKEVLKNEGQKIIEKSKKTKIPKEEVDEEEDDEEEQSDSDTEYTIQKVSNKTKTRIKPALIINEPVNDDVHEKVNTLSKSFEELKVENQNLKKSFIQADHLHTINSMTRKMLLKF
jgi:hypothetical protein